MDFFRVKLSHFGLFAYRKEAAALMKEVLS